MKALRWLIVLLVGAGLAGLLASMREPITLSFNDWNIALPFGFAFFLLYVFICIILLIDRVVQQYANFIRWLQIRRTYKARSIMLNGLSLLAARDAEGARKAANEIHDLWHGDMDDPFLLVFEGRLAEEEGDFLQAQEYYTRLEKQKDAKLVALRAQLRLAQHTGDVVALKRLSKMAIKLAPNDLSLYEARVAGLTSRGQWDRAHTVFKTLARRNVMSEDMVASRRADLYLEQSAAALQLEKYGEAQRLAKQAHKLSPSVEAFAAELEAVIASGNTKEANKRLAEAWRDQADAALLPYWAQLAPDENKFKYYEQMLKANQAHPLTHTALVKAAVDENRAMEARAHLEALYRADPDGVEYAESKALVAEKIDHDASTAAQWRAQADALRAARVSAITKIRTKPSRLLPDVFE